MRVYLTEAFHALGVSFTAPQPGDAGYDLYAVATISIAPGERGLVPTGLHVELPPGYVGIVKDRSSVAATGLHALAGVIDAGYRGEIRLLLLNTTPAPITVEAGRRIAQMLVVPYYAAGVETVEQLDDLTATDRGAGGFGSTGE